LGLFAVGKNRLPCGLRGGNTVRLIFVAFKGNNQKQRID